MTSLELTLPIDEVGVALRPRAPRPGFLDRLFGVRTVVTLNHLPPEEQALAFALADLRALAEGDEGALQIAAERVFLSHALVARLDAATAEVLGLPPLVDLIFSTSLDGMLGAPTCRLRYAWLRDDRPVATTRVGAILQTDRGLRRLPSFILRAIEIADAFDGRAPFAEHWAALGRFRRALEPEAAEDARTRPDFAARMRMTEFLSSLKVKVADALSLSPFEAADGVDFDPVPFSRETLAKRGGADAEVRESEAEIGGEALEAFQRDFRRSGAKAAYRVGENAFLVIDAAASSALAVMARAQRAPAAERTAFALNPQPAIMAAERARLEAAGRFAGLSDAEVEATVEAAVEPVLVETAEFAERVIGVGRWRRPALPLAAVARTTWLPEDFDEETRARIEALDLSAAQALKAAVDAALETGPTDTPAPVTLPDGARVAPSAALSAALAARIERLEREPLASGEAGGSAAERGPTVLRTAENFFDVAWLPDRAPRKSARLPDPPARIVTPLMQHQKDSFDWMIAAWLAGLPGVLNADEQGLGKTLQTIAFLAWLQDHLSDGGAPDGPVLVVAPTSLLENWEAEVDRHLSGARLGSLVKLYGAALGARRRPGQRGVDIEDGGARLDFDDVEQACAQGRGGGVWILTTYATMTNYQHSLARLPFSVVVFDEIQALKNPASLRAAAGRAMKANFRIGLTGTPIENRTADLWAIMDQLAPGALGSLQDFARAFGEPEAEAMQKLHDGVFKSQADLPPLGLRRLKRQVARSLPPKRRLMHPRLMPAGQASRYEAARADIAAGSPGAMLKLLHHIRTVSAHPGMEDAPGDDPDAFIAASARLSAAMDVLAAVRARGERALVFIEHQKLQHRFAELARRTFDLESVPIINGATPIPRRMAIVRRFQRHLDRDEGFDLLVLGPRAAGVGLTLTAATHVVHLSRWWNPAVEEQCNDRVHRIGQTRPVTIHTPLAIHPRYLTGSFDCLLQDLMARKKSLADAALWPMGDTEADAETLEHAMRQAAPESAVTGPAPGHLEDFSVVGLAGFAPPEAMGDGVCYLEWLDGWGGGAVVLNGAAMESPQAAKSALRALAAAKPNVGIAAIIALSSQSTTVAALKAEGVAPVAALDGALATLWPNYVLCGADRS